MRRLLKRSLQRLLVAVLGVFCVWLIVFVVFKAAGTARFWRNTNCPPDNEPAVWVGAGTRDIGFSLTALTFQVTHATDSDTNVERDFIVAELNGKGVIKDVMSYRAQQRLQAGRVNRYITDGEITAATLTIKT